MLEVYNEFRNKIKMKQEQEISLIKRKIDESKANEENSELDADKNKKLKSDAEVICMPAKFQKYFL
jgi:hypothetical protein